MKRKLVKNISFLFSNELPKSGIGSNFMHTIDRSASDNEGSIHSEEKVKPNRNGDGFLGCYSKPNEMK